eukprot:10485639-Ditylum_brightwellii.AAC.1
MNVTNPIASIRLFLLVSNKEPSCLDHIDIHRNYDINSQHCAHFFIQDYNVRSICFHLRLYFLGHVIGDRELVGDGHQWFWLVLLPVGVNRWQPQFWDAAGCDITTGVICPDLLGDLPLLLKKIPWR